MCCHSSLESTAGNKEVEPESGSDANCWGQKMLSILISIRTAYTKIKNVVHPETWLLLGNFPETAQSAQMCA
jgi:hypothetical protein